MAADRLTVYHKGNKGERYLAGQLDHTLWVYLEEMGYLHLGFRNLARFGLTLQTVKTALAAALSWWLAARVSHNSYPSFAPLAAILTVQVTIADSLEKAIQRITGIILGVAVSLFIGHWLSLGTVSIFLVTLVGMGFSVSLRLPAPIISQVAVSSLLVLTFGHNQGYAFGRIIETTIGCAAAVVINASLIPPNAIPGAEASLLNLSRRADAVLRSLVLLFGPKGGETDGFVAVEELIKETDKTLKAMQLAGAFGPITFFVFAISAFRQV